MASRGAFVIAVAAAAVEAAMIAIGARIGVNLPWSLLWEVAWLVATVALAPVMLGFVEMSGAGAGGRGRLALAIGLTTVATWTAGQVCLLLGWANTEVTLRAYQLVQSVALMVIGAWLVLASLLAGSWLRRAARALGVLAGLGLAGIGGGVLMDPSLGPNWFYRVVWVLLAWAVVIGRVFAERSRAAETSGLQVEPQRVGASTASLVIRPLLYGVAAWVIGGAAAFPLTRLPQSGPGPQEAIVAGAAWLLALGPLACLLAGSLAAETGSRRGGPATAFLAGVIGVGTSVFALAFLLGGFIPGLSGEGAGLLLLDAPMLAGYVVGFAAVAGWRWRDGRRSGMQAPG
ncbi:MAG: hypothetical protein WCK58_00180 [Chloroflexota bacterium]